MNQPIQLVGRLTPQAKISLEQRTSTQRTVAVKRIKQELEFNFNEDVIPFNQIIDQRKLIQSIPVIQYVPVTPSRLVTQPCSLSRRSQRRSQSKSEMRSDKNSEKQSIFSKSQKSFCTCGHSKKNVAQIKVNRPSQKSLSVKSRQSKKSVRSKKSSVKQTQPALSTTSTKKGCPYHERCEHKPISYSQHREPLPNPEDEKKQKMMAFSQTRKILLQQYSAKSLLKKEPSIYQENNKPKVPWIYNEKKVEEGKLRQSRIKKFLETHHQERSKSKQKVKQQTVIVQPIPEEKKKQLQKRKELMTQRPSSCVKRNKAEMQRIKKIINQIKEEKLEKINEKNKVNNRLASIRKEQKEILNHCRSVAFKPTEQEVEKAFQDFTINV